LGAPIESFRNVDCGMMTAPRIRESEICNP
jgi:hypothetical protein